MTKSLKLFLACLGTAAFVSVAAAADAMASGRLDPVRVWGPVTKTETGGEDIKFFFMNNQSGQSYAGELQVIVSNVYTRILDATTGLPFPYDDMKPGDTAYVYVGPALSASLNPMANASLVLCNVPMGYKVPDYLTVESLSWNTGKTEAVLTATNGAVFTVPSTCETAPYLSKNIVTIDDLTPGTSCLLWSDNQNQATRIINFSKPGVPIEELPMEPGWHQLNNNWYYYDKDGAMAHGWVTDGGDRYYMDPESGVMRTGFLTLEGSTYYFQQDGRLLTSPMLFTPDENGVLH